MRRLEAPLLWTGDGDRVLEARTVLIGDDGLISDILPGGGKGSLFVMPSFVDSHCHFTWMGLMESMPDLSGVRGAAGLLAAVGALRDGGSGILQCERFDESEWDDPSLPTLGELDAVTGGRPAFIRRVCGHKALVNSAMMAMLPPGTPDLDRERGILTEDMVINWNAFFPPGEEELSRAVGDAGSRAFSEGVTAVGTIESWPFVEAILGTGTDVRLSVNVLYRDMDRMLRDSPAASDRFRAGGVKLFLDGALGARNAAVSAGYLDAPSGRLIHDDDELAGMIERIWCEGFQPVVHAIGGKALGQLDRVSTGVSRRIGSRLSAGGLRVEHAEELLPAWPGTWDPSLHAFSMQPNFVARWQQPGGLYEARLPRESARRLNPFGLVRRCGFRLGFGSDNMPFGPLRGIPGAVGHPVPEFRLPGPDALRAYTLDAAGMCGFPELARPLEAGRPADLVVLSGNPLDSDDMSGIRVVETILGGETVYGSADPAGPED
jgi:hypothetical protein